MRIDIVFDTVCPWCFVGKRRFDRALKLRPGLRANVQYRSFLLNPDLPPEGVDRREYLERKFGGPHQYDRIAEALVITGRSEGIEFDLNSIRRTPNSANSHRLVRMAQTRGCPDEAVDLLFRSYFERSLDIGDLEILLELAEELGFEPNEAREHLSGETDLNAVYTENARMHRLGITGVPCYIFNEGRAIAGAQEPEILTRMLDMAAAQETEQPTMQSNG
jgi:predicted DsbA family dithiol-disulfide isomerase